MGKVTGQCPQITTFFEEKGEPKRYRTEVFPLTNLTPYRWAKPAHKVTTSQATWQWILHHVSFSFSLFFNYYDFLSKPPPPPRPRPPSPTYPSLSPHSPHWAFKLMESCTINVDTIIIIILLLVVLYCWCTSVYSVVCLATNLISLMRW